VNATCTLTVTFAPQALGARTAVLTLTDNSVTGSQQTVNLTGSGLLTYGLYITSNGCGALTLTGQAFTNSYDSSAGAYASTKENSGGNVAVAGSAVLSGQATIYGTLSLTNPTVGKCDNKSPNGGVSLSARLA